jgi:transcriptional regulator with XRE-family HTH domain
MVLQIAIVPNILGIMLDLISIGGQIARRRKTLKLSQAALARKAGVSRATLDALENGRAGELGFSKVTKLLSALGLELTLQTASSQRPTLDELMQEDRDDKSLDRRR